MEHQRPLCSRGAAVHFPTFPDSTIMQSILQLSAFLESFSPFLFIVLSLFILLLNKSIVDRDLLVVNPVLESLASSRSLDIGQYLSFISFSSLTFPNLLATPSQPLSLSPFLFVSEPIPFRVVSQFLFTHPSLVFPTGLVSFCILSCPSSLSTKILSFGD